MASRNIKNIKKQRIKRDPKAIMTYLVIMLVFISELLFYTWCRVQSVKMKYDIAELTETARKLTAMQDSLKIELARLKSPQRIAKIARTQLGLITPTPKQTIVLP
jgi:cell division protein FtsL